MRRHGGFTQAGMCRVCARGFKVFRWLRCELFIINIVGAAAVLGLLRVCCGSQQRVAGGSLSPAVLRVGTRGVCHQPCLAGGAWQQRPGIGTEREVVS